MILAAFAVIVTGQIALADRPAFVSNAISAISANRPEPIAAGFKEIVEVGDEHSHPIAATQMIASLAGCHESGVRVLHDDVYTVDYQCPARRALAKGCDSGDLFLILDASRSSLAVAHRRKLTVDCPPPAPPVPPGFGDPREYYQRSKLIIDTALAGDDRTLARFVLTSGQIFVAPTTTDHKPPLKLTAQNLAVVFSGCTREGQIKVDQSGASTSYRCSNKTLNGLYAVDFDYVGQSLYRVWLQTPESRAAMNSGIRY